MKENKNKIERKREKQRGKNSMVEIQKMDEVFLREGNRAT